MPTTLQPFRHMLTAALVWIAAGVLLLTLGRAVTTRGETATVVAPTPAATVVARPRSDAISCPGVRGPC